MKTSSAGRAAITSREGNKLTAYRDSVGILTIGVGHTSVAGPPNVTPGLKITAAESDAILSRDLAKFEKAVNNAVKVPLAQNEFDALVSLTFNIGGGGFAKSSLVRKLNAGDKAGAADAFLSWNKAGGRVLPGLTKRRKAERLQFLSTSKPAPRQASPARFLDVPGDEPVAQPVDVSTALTRLIQQQLREKGYFEVGDADGSYGPRTRDAIMSFQSDNDMEATGAVSGDILAQLADAPHRPVSEERANATSASLKDSKSITLANQIKTVGMGVVTAGGLGGVVSIEDAVDKYQTITTFLKTVSPWVIGIVVGGIVIYIAQRIIREQVRAYQAGRHL